MATATCLDSNQNAVSCGDADCSYGPCGDVTTTGSQSGSGCLDQNQNPVPCNSPNCTYGDCAGPSSSSALTGALSANSGSTGGGTTTAVASNGTGIGSIVAALANVGAQTYVATNQPPKTTIGLSGVSLPSTSTTTLLLLGVAVIVAFFAFGGKKRA